MKKEYLPLEITLRLLASEDIVTSSIPTEENEGEGVTPDWWFGY